jgi:hypothetical protein
VGEGEATPILTGIGDVKQRKGRPAQGGATWRGGGGEAWGGGQHGGRAATAQGRRACAARLERATAADRWAPATA